MLIIKYWRKSTPSFVIGTLIYKSTLQYKLLIYQYIIKHCIKAHISKLISRSYSCNYLTEAQFNVRWIVDPVLLVQSPKDIATVFQALNSLHVDTTYPSMFNVDTQRTLACFCVKNACFFLNCSSFQTAHSELEVVTHLKFDAAPLFWTLYISCICFLWWPDYFVARSISMSLFIELICYLENVSSWCPYNKEQSWPPVFVSEI